MTDRLRDLRGKFYQIENAFLLKYGKTVGVYGISAYNVIAMCANADGENAFPSYHKIAELTGMSQRKAVEAVNQLVELGVLLRESRYKEDGKGQTSNLYTLTPIPYAPDAPPPMHVVHTPYARGAHDQDSLIKTPLEEDDADACASSPSAHRTPPPQPSLPLPLKESEPRTEKETAKAKTPNPRLRTPPSPAGAAGACWEMYLTMIKEYEAQAVLAFGRERKGINDIAKAGRTPEEIEEAFRILKKTPFWRTQHLSAQSLGQQMGAVLGAAEPQEAQVLEYTW